MNLQEIRDDLLRKVGVETPGDAPSYVLSDVLAALNMAGQALNAAGDPFWFVRSDTGTGASHALSGHSVKRVVQDNSARIPLSRVHSVTELNRFHRIYLGMTDAEVADATNEPMAYCVEQNGEDGEITVYIGPSNLSSTGVRIDYVPNFEPWEVADLASDTKVPDVPQGYVETVFLPVARYYLTRSHWFSREDLKRGIEQDFSGAVGMMRAVNPEIHVPFADQVDTRKSSTRTREAAA